MTSQSYSILALALFWISAAWVAYVVVVFPGLVWLLGRGRRAAEAAPTLPAPRPRISVVIAVHDEEAEIDARLRNVLDTDYPRDLVELVVASDGSTDGTDAICRRFDAAPLLLVGSAQRRGKTPVLDDAVRQSSGDVLVFSDATTRFRRDTLPRIVARFADPTVGCVGGFVRYGDRSADGGGVHASIRRLEDAVRRAECELGYVPSVSGAIHALRRGLYRPVDAAATRDLIDPAQTAAAGLRVVLEPACVVDERGPSRSIESARARVRVTLRGFASLPIAWTELARAHRWLPAWQLVSHKPMRWLVWIPLGIGWLAHAWLSTRSPLWAASWALHSACWLGSVAAALAAWRGSQSPWAQALGFPAAQIGAMALGTLRFWLGDSAPLWRPDRVRVAP